MLCTAFVQGYGKMSAENSEYDVVEMDFPEYEEEFPPIGTVAAERSFSSNKIEIYRRNTELALTEQKKALAEERAGKVAEQPEFDPVSHEAEEIIKQPDVMQSLAENLPPDELMDFIFGPGRTDEQNSSNKILKAVVTIAAFLLFLLIEYIINH